MRITPELLQAAVGCATEPAARFAPYLDAACAHYQIDSQARMAAFLAQIGHESGSLRYVRELASGEAYEGRKDLGNTQPGDGRRYRGRGLIQVTGRSNYRQTAQRMQALGAPDFEDFPEALEEPRWAAWSAADWWHAHGCSGLADVGEFIAIGRLINRGNAASTKPANGEDDRLARWERARQALATDAPPAPEKPAAADPGQPASHFESEWDMNNPAPALNTSAAPVESRPTTEQKGKPMAPFIAAALSAVLGAAPELIDMFKGDSKSAARNSEAAKVVVNVAKEAIGAANEQDLIERLADPAAAATVRQAVRDRMFEIVEAGGGGIAGARQASAAYLQPGAAGFWLNPSFWVSCALLAMVFMLLADVFYVHPETYVGELRTQIVTGLLMIIGMVGGYWIGTSISSARKDDRVA
jgi:putative chitinase